MRLDTSDGRFTGAARQWLRSLDDDTLSDAKAIFEASPGYYPTTLLSLRQAELQDRGLTTSTQQLASIAEATSLPVCHPVDYEWRFSEGTATWLARNAMASLKGGETVAHVGTPTTFIVAARNRGSCRHLLLERSRAVIDTLASRSGEGNSIIPIDLDTDVPPCLGAAAAIVDPPWYPDDTVVFLAATSHACRLGASILLCQPTIATRPGVSEEREALLAELPRLGLAHTGTQPAAVRYVTPHFEAMSLRLAPQGTQVPVDWRKGDLLTLRKVTQVDYVRRSSQRDRWSEAQFGPVRIKLRQSDEVDLGNLIPGDVLNTVSRRDPVRQRIGFWTSGNRVFTLAHPKNIGNLVALCETDLRTGRFSLARTVDHAGDLGVSIWVCRKLFMILLAELEEHPLVKDI